MKKKIKKRSMLKEAKNMGCNMEECEYEEEEEESED